MTVLLNATHISKQYAGNTILDNINIQVDSGQVLGLLGQNGVGKSTTMQIISGCTSADKGDLTLADIDLHNNPAAYKQELGFLPEHPPLYNEMTVKTFLWQVAKLRLIPAQKVQTQYDRAISLCALEDKQDKSIRHLSKGYQQRVGIAQAIIHEPKLVILDEPTVGLDPIQLEHTRTLIKNLATAGAVILSTHILQEVEACCDKVIILHQGQIALEEETGNISSLTDTFK